MNTRRNIEKHEITDEQAAILSAVVETRAVRGKRPIDIAEEAQQTDVPTSDHASVGSSTAAQLRALVQAGYLTAVYRETDGITDYEPTPLGRQIARRKPHKPNVGKPGKRPVKPGRKDQRDDRA